MSFSFNNLDLSNTEVAKGGQTLKPGRYVAKVKDAKVRQTRSNGAQLECQFTDEGGEGTIKAWLNIHVPSSQEATRIGREQLKALLVHGGHPNPNRPGDVTTVKGLRVGIGVVKDEYQKDGETRTGAKVSYFFDPAEHDGVGQQGGGMSRSQIADQAQRPPENTGGAPGYDDNIPF